MGERGFSKRGFGGGERAPWEQGDSRTTTRTQFLLGADDGSSLGGPDVPGVPDASAAAMSRAVIGASIMAKAYEQLVIPTCPASGEWRTGR